MFKLKPISNDIYNLLDFLFKFALVYIPCVMGAICGIYFKTEYLHKNDRSKKRRNVIADFGLSLSSSIVPSLVILIAEYLLPEHTQTNHILKYGIAMLFGFIGSDRITEYLMNITNLFKVLKAISEGMSGLSKLSGEAEALNSMKSLTDDTKKKNE